MRRIAVYCGSATPADPAYMECARTVGRELAQRGIGVVYGGGRMGLMGAVADSALEAGGEVIGVIPTVMVQPEIAHDGCTRLEIVKTMHERKARFTDLSDGFLTLPGGVGTMDELWEAVSWAQIGYHDKPIGLLNAAGYYDGLIQFLNHMTQVGFVRSEHAEMIVHGDDLAVLLGRMASHTPHRALFPIGRDDL